MTTEYVSRIIAAEAHLGAHQATLDEWHVHYTCEEPAQVYAYAKGDLALIGELILEGADEADVHEAQEAAARPLGYGEEAGTCAACPSEYVHLTRITSAGEVYGHPSTSCDPAGCAGRELYWGTTEDLDADDDLLQKVVEIRAGKITSQMNDDDRDTLSCAECRCSCGCTEHATTTDDAGEPSCDACTDYYVDADGDVVCSREQGEDECRYCGEAIAWTGVLTGVPGQSNWREGTCGCRGWQQTENGGAWDLTEGEAWPVAVGDHVESGDTHDDYDHGTVTEIEGGTATVAWEWSMTRTTCPVESLRPYDPEIAASMAAEAKALEEATP